MEVHLGGWGRGCGHWWAAGALCETHPLTSPSARSRYAVDSMRESRAADGSRDLVVRTLRLAMNSCGGDHTPPANPPPLHQPL